MLRLRNLSKTFTSKTNDDVVALDSISLDFRSDETTVVLGPSGSGKSTLLRCVNLLEFPDSGTLEFADVTVDFGGRVPEQTKRRVRAHSAMVFQDFQLFPHLKARENVTLGVVKSKGRSKDEADQLADDLLAKVGLAGRESAYPYQLSGGQRQRVAIARALAMEPDFLLCDEPTSALDPELAVEVRRVLADIASADTGLIVVTHDMAFARHSADRIIFLQDGRVDYDGDPAAFFDAPTERIAKFLAIFAAS
ncbi:amino acid ABC transporter ATP-binding protein [Trueperella bialowiezensis]|uniref:Glutamine transport ATP-binding protein GlnQ n=1 Tax=Trueperella bialowiezensis TaxID=312285 RepID=A0A3S4VBL4_9ACTO|nr:amino acid ABC transporter ATP-binding protein [Trueperella bialowiezensis]VEI13901.1 Glutamine transport ATP-binding protein GlnQ [Trueperella bialowiezensis]